MGKTLIIKGADFAQNAIERQLVLSLWVNAEPNANTGVITVSPSAADISACCEAINIEGYTKIWGASNPSNYLQLMFYSQEPVAGSSAGFISATDEPASTYNRYNPYSIPAGAKYVVVWCFGTGARENVDKSEYFVAR